MMAQGVARLVGAVLAAVTVSGCASGLDVSYPSVIAHRGVLASSEPRRVIVGPVVDRRVDQTRIGARRKNGDPITTTRPVADIVREALVVELTKNGHTVVGDGGDISLSADVEEFWMDTVGSQSTAHHLGRVAIALSVTAGASGDTLLSRRYVGIKRRGADADDKAAWREVMDVALARAIRDVVTDPDLVAALSRLSRVGGLRASTGGMETPYRTP